jgi:hypothetical protein
VSAGTVDQLRLLDPMARYASLILLGAIPLVVLAFWPLYLSRPFTAVDRYTHLHAVAGTLWLVMLIAQPAAIHFRRYALHRVLGRTSYGIAALFAIAGILLSHYRLVSMTDATFASEGFAHFLPFYATVVFVLAYCLGLWYRRNRAAHSRFMLCTAIPLIDPVLGRVLAFYFPPLPDPRLYQVVTFGLATIIAALLVFTFRGSASARRALIGYFAVLVVLEVGWFTIAPTATWLGAVHWFRGLPLT